MSDAVELELEAALDELHVSLVTEKMEAASAALPRVLSLCAELRGAQVGGPRFRRLRDLADAALRRAQALQQHLGEQLRAAGTSRIAIIRYRDPRRAA